MSQHSAGLFLPLLNGILIKLTHAPSPLRYGFSADGNMVQERYESADIGGQRNTPGFAGATATLEGVCITADGALRVGLTPGGSGAYFVFKKLRDGERDGWLGSKGLPLEGGTGL